MDKKTEYVEKLSAQMVEWDAQIDRLKFQADSAAAELRSEYRKEIDALLQKRKEADLKLQGISTASDEMWEELKDGTDSVWDEVSASLRKAVLKIK
jgi:uncharacterized protein involved in exopolysaccharide biosynthesis